MSQVRSPHRGPCRRGRGHRATRGSFAVRRRAPEADVRGPSGEASRADVPAPRERAPDEHEPRAHAAARTTGPAASSSELACRAAASDEAERVHARSTDAASASRSWTAGARPDRAVRRGPRAYHGGAAAGSHGHRAVRAAPWASGRRASSEDADWAVRGGAWTNVGRTSGEDPDRAVFSRAWAYSGRAYREDTDRAVRRAAAASGDAASGSPRDRAVRCGRGSSPCAPGGASGAHADREVRPRSRAYRAASASEPTRPWSSSGGFVRPSDAPERAAPDNDRIDGQYGGASGAGERGRAGERAADEREADARRVDPAWADRVPDDAR